MYEKYFVFRVTRSVADFGVGGDVTRLRGRVDVWHEHPSVAGELRPHPTGPERPQVAGRLSGGSVHERRVQEMSRCYHLRVQKTKTRSFRRLEDNTTISVRQSSLSSSTRLRARSTD